MVRVDSISRLSEDPERREGPIRVFGIGAGPLAPGLHSTSRLLLEFALEDAKASGCEIRQVDLAALRFHPCPDGEAQCSWPCRLSLLDPDDQLGDVYESLVHWADVVVISTALEEGPALPGGLRRFIDRLRCIRHELDVEQRLLIRNKVAAFVMCGPWHPTAGPAVELIGHFANLGFAVPPFPIAGCPPTSCLAPGAERLERLLEVHPESIANAEALVHRAVDLAARLSPRRHLEPAGSGVAAAGR
ncbi:MAG TPA: NAD(P)H-dependent oxidoreductase [Vulgatibacter sp.]